MTIKTSGYYRSEGTLFEDAMASTTITGAIYRYLKFNPNGTYLMMYTDKGDVDFMEYLKQLSEDEKKGKEHGTYAVEEDGSIRFDVWFENPAITNTYYFTLLQSGHLADKDGKFFEYIGYD